MQQSLQDNLTSAYRSSVVEREEGDYPELIRWQWHSVDQDKKQQKGKERKKCKGIGKSSFRSLS